MARVAAAPRISATTPKNTAPRTRLRVTVRGRLALDRGRSGVDRIGLALVFVPEGHLLDELHLRAEEGAHALPAMDAADRLAEEWGDGEDGDLGWGDRDRERDRIGHHYLGQGGLLDALERVARKDAVRGARVDGPRPLGHEGIDRLHQRAGGIDLVIDDHRVLASHLANDVHQLGLVLVADAAR